MRGPCRRHNGSRPAVPGGIFARGSARHGAGQTASPAGGRGHALVCAGIAAGVVVGAFSPCGHAEGISPGTLRGHAAAVRSKAEKELAVAREVRVRERRAWTARLAEEYKRLDAARKRLAEAEADAARLERAARQRTTPEEARRLVAFLVRRSCEAVETDVPDSSSIGAVETALTNAVTARMGELREGVRIRTARERIVDRAGDGASVPVLRLGTFAAYACGDTVARCGLLRAMPDGRDLVVGPRFDMAQREMLRAALAGRTGLLPIDVTGALADRAPQVTDAPRAWLERGGPFIYPILLVAVLGVALALERMFYLLTTQRPARLVAQVIHQVRNGQLGPAREAARSARGPTGRIVLAAVEAHAEEETEREAAMETVLLAEAPRLERSLSLLSALASVAPLLGLLGTVSGMIATFDTIAAAGTGNPRLLSGGISEALITTQLGLMVGIPLLLVHAWLARWIERREAVLECDAIQIFGLQEKQDAER